MNRYLLTAIVLFSFCSIQAQSLTPCGTNDYRSKWLKDYQANPDNYDTKTDEILYVPLTIHLVGSDGGTGYFSQARLLDALCTLNDDFIETEMHFFVEGDIRYIDNSAWNNHETVLEGAEMMFANNVENTINCYFVADPAGNCGYNLPYAGMAVAKSCANATDHTWAHEMGHQLSLPHPFLGWEGGISYDNSIGPNYGEPAPDTVLYDYTFFQEIQYTDTLIVDTAVVERVDGSNCTYAADGFCDTEPDYLAFRWNCNADAESSQLQHDPNDEPFRSDGTLIMSYADDACSYRFSEEQQAAMRANLIDEKPELLYNQTPGQVPGTTTLISPINNELTNYELTVLDWEDTQNATGYLVRLEVLLGSSSIFVGSFSTDISEITLEDELLEGSNYRWSVRAYNDYYFCENELAQGEFTAAEVSSVNTISGLISFEIFPNILSANNQEVQINLTNQEPHNWSWNVMDLHGKILKSNIISNSSIAVQEKINLGNLPSGVYFFGISNKAGSHYKKIIVQ